MMMLQHSCLVRQILTIHRHFSSISTASKVPVRALFLGRGASDQLVGDGGRLGFVHENPAFHPTPNPFLDSVHSIALGGIRSVALTSTGQIFACLQGLWRFRCIGACIIENCSLDWWKVLGMEKHATFPLLAYILLPSLPREIHFPRIFYLFANCNRLVGFYAALLGDSVFNPAMSPCPLLYLNPKVLDHLTMLSTTDTGLGSSTLYDKKMHEEIKELLPIRKGLLNQTSSYLAMYRLPRTLVHILSFACCHSSGSYYGNRGSLYLGLRRRRWQIRPWPWSGMVLAEEGQVWNWGGEDDEGQVLSWGFDGHCQLGHSSIQCQKIPAVIDALADQHAIHVTCGGSSLAAITVLAQMQGTFFISYNSCYGFIIRVVPVASTMSSEF
ncbi:hypothetical protein D5086_021204 [Populus alba]|uniref:Uncharacterized protein n=1 Tax=Populus alba TaxID=43335 RepID=A0ACC4BC31_POPAL